MHIALLNKNFARYKTRKNLTAAVLITAAMPES